MLNPADIKEHMEVSGSDGEHVGTVDKVEGNSIKLTKTDSPDHEHHTLSLDLVDRVADNRVYLKVAKTEATTLKA